jgi:hypothetical protein
MLRDYFIFKRRMQFTKRDKDSIAYRYVLDGLVYSAKLIEEALKYFKETI